jgi:hypothetical protein
MVMQWIDRLRADRATTRKARRRQRALDEAYEAHVHDLFPCAHTDHPYYTPCTPGRCDYLCCTGAPSCYQCGTGYVGDPTNCGCTMHNDGR